MVWEFASSTGNVEALAQFLKCGVLFSLNVCHAVNISRFSAFPKEDERLILAGTPLKVTGVLPLPGGKATMIQMEEDLSCPPLITGFVLKDPAPWEIKDAKLISIDREEDDEGEMEKVELGSGAFGRVYAGKFRGAAVAIKQIKNDVLGQDGVA